MDSVEAAGSRTPLGTLTQSQQNSEAGDADFSKLTPSHFGISTESFLTFKEKDKSRVVQLKSRRRSTIGVRGSPETNSLIRFRAKAAMKTPPRTPQHMLASPLLSGCDSIKQKMAAFQRLMGDDDEDLEQSATLMTEGKDGRVGGSLSSDGQAVANACLEERENRLTPSSHCPAVTPPPSKRSRRVPRGLCEEEIKEEPLSDLQNIPVQMPEASSSKFNSPETNLGLGSDSQSQLMSLPMLSKPEVMRTDDVEVSSVSKKKRVRFGAPLSPEFFDKTLPPSTPLQKGATPIRPPSSTGRKHSLLKTPQRFEPPMPQPDFNSPRNNGGSPVFAVPRSRSEEVDSDEVFLCGGKISFPIMEEEFDNPPDDCRDAVLAEDPELALHHQPPTAGTEYMNAAFQQEEDLLSSSTADQTSMLTAEAEPEPGLELQRSRREQQLESPASTTEAPRSRGRKRKQQAEKETETKRSSRAAAASDEEKMKPADDDENETETRRSSRTAAASAKGKMKNSAVKRRFGSKEVDRSLYGKRDYASKNPLLSPIVESATSSLVNTPTQPHPDANSDSSQTTSAHHGKTDSSDGTAGLVAAAALWRQRFLQKTNARDPATTVADNSASQLEADVASADESGETVEHAGMARSGTKASRARRSFGRPAGRRRSGNSARAKRLSGAKESETEEPMEDESAGSRSESLETSVRSEAVQQQVNDPSFTAEHTADLTSNEKLPHDEDMAAESPNGKKHAQKGPRVNSTGGLKEENEPRQGPLQTKPSPERTEEEGESSQELTEASLAVKRSEFGSVKSSGEQNEPVLEPWQEANFNIEDVLRPAVKSRGSVRRSLRNRRSVDVQASGLAWVDHTSPELLPAGRRRTRSRLSAAFQPSALLDTEEPQQNLGE
ncbi:cell division cycle-associated protein 2 [Salminus brasiliensis]|uniref:cell division cycle-associated protein 2 n=1 Tax=Salminus brasiliensis TaxID=930266 RepID=UPI003B837CE1